MSLFDTVVGKALQMIFFFFNLKWIKYKTPFKQGLTHYNYFTLMYLAKRNKLAQSIIIYFQAADK